MNKTFGFRCPGELIRSLDAFAAEWGGASRDGAIVFLCKRFFAEPKFYDPIDVIELRKPADMSIFVSVDENTNEKLRSAAEEHGVTVAAILRNILYHELREVK